MQTGKILLVWAFLCALHLSLVGCSEHKELLGNLNVRQSIDVWVALTRAGIKADRTKVSTGSNEKYSISVSNHDYPLAMKILDEYHLPTDNSETLDSYTAQKGFVPDLREISSLRLDHALALELERILGGLAGVMQVRAIVRSNLIAGSADEGINSNIGSANQKLKAAPSASIVIRYISTSGNLPFALDRVKQIAAKAVPGLLPDSIEITTTRILAPGATIAINNEAEGSDISNPTGVSALVPLFPFLFKVAESEHEKALWQFFVILLSISFTTAVVGAYLGWTLRRNSNAGANTGAGKPKSVFLEASFRSDTNPREGGAALMGGKKALKDSSRSSS